MMRINSLLINTSLSALDVLGCLEQGLNVHFEHGVCHFLEVCLRCSCKRVSLTNASTTLSSDWGQVNSTDSLAAACDSCSVRTGHWSQLLSALSGSSSGSCNCSSCRHHHHPLQLTLQVIWGLQISLGSFSGSSKDPLWSQTHPPSMYRLAQ